MFYYDASVKRVQEFEVKAAFCNPKITAQSQFGFEDLAVFRRTN